VINSPILICSNACVSPQAAEIQDELFEISVSADAGSIRHVE